MSETEPAHFANVDLDVQAEPPLDALVTALAPVAGVLVDVTDDLRRFELDPEPGEERPDHDALRSPTDFVARWCDVLEDLPPDARAVWERATRRLLSIGLGSGGGSHQLIWAFPPALLARVAALGVTLDITLYPVYPPD